MLEPTFDLNSVGYNIVYSGINAAYKQLFYLINMKKGTDKYNLDKGVDIARYYYAQEESNTLSALENEISDQIKTYTNYNVTQVHCMTKIHAGNIKVLYVILRMYNDKYVILSTDGTNTSIIDSTSLK